MEKSYAKIPTSYLLGSFPAVVDVGKSSTSYEVPYANMQTFPPANGGDKGRGYQSLTGPTGMNMLIGGKLSYPTESLFSAMLPTYMGCGPIWIFITLVFVLSALGNYATFLMDKRTDSSTSWSFDVGYITTVLWSIYGYAIVVPLGFYFLLKYVGSNASLIQFWCMWGYSLFIFILVSILIVLIGGGTSACFVATNLRSYVEQNDLFIVMAVAFWMQIALGLFIKVWFFP